MSPSFLRDVAPDVCIVCVCVCFFGPCVRGMYTHIHTYTHTHMFKESNEFMPLTSPKQGKTGFLYSPKTAREKPAFFLFEYISCLYHHTHARTHTQNIDIHTHTFRRMWHKQEKSCLPEGSNKENHAALSSPDSALSKNVWPPSFWDVHVCMYVCMYVS